MKIIVKVMDMINKDIVLAEVERLVGSSRVEWRECTLLSPGLYTLPTDTVIMIWGKKDMCYEGHKMAVNSIIFFLNLHIGNPVQTNKYILCEVR